MDTCEFSIQLPPYSATEEQVALQSMLWPADAVLDRFSHNVLVFNHYIGNGNKSSKKSIQFPKTDHIPKTGVSGFLYVKGRGEFAAAKVELK